jgi:hypothetical protein
MPFAVRSLPHAFAALIVKITCCRLQAPPQADTSMMCFASSASDSFDHNVAVMNSLPE